MTSSDPRSKATVYLQNLAGGEERAADDLFPLVYDELHSIAARCLGDRAQNHTLQPTALLHEAYLRLVEPRVRADYDNRRHFLGVAAKAMRSALVDHARRRNAEKRGGAHARIALEDVPALAGDEAPDLAQVDAGLERLAALDPELAKIVELRFFGGLTTEETAGVLGISSRSVERGWRVARMRLSYELERGA